MKAISIFGHISVNLKPIEMYAFSYKNALVWMGLKYKPASALSRMLIGYAAHCFL